MNDATTTAPSPSWLHRNRLWLPAALLLGALALLLPWRAAQHEYGRRGFTHPLDAKPSGWTEYEGARWRLVEVRRENAEATLEDYGFVDASRLIVVYEVIPGREIDLKTLDGCVGRLSDDKGRHWGGRVGSGDEFASAAQRRLEQALQLDTRCASRRDAALGEVKAQRGQPFRFFHGYLIPRGLPESGLSAEIILNPYETTPPGSYLRFKLPAAAGAPAPGA